MVTNYTEYSFVSLQQHLTKLFPSSELLVDSGKAYTNKMIDDRANDLAYLLAAQGVRKGTHVGIYGNNSANWIICFFAIQKLGAFCVLLNPALTPEEIAKHSDAADITHLCFGDSVHTVNEESFVNAL